MGRNRRGSRGGGRSGEVPNSTTQPEQTSGLTPVAQVGMQESLRDVRPESNPIIPGSLGYNYALHEYLEPTENQPQIYVRVIYLNPYFVTECKGIDTSDIAKVESDVEPAEIGFSKISNFWVDAPQKLLDKILKRDSVRFLPDTFDYPELLPWREILFTAARMQLSVIRTLIDTTSWNEGTQYIRANFARKNRRCLEAENVLSTIEVSPLWRLLADSEPVVSPRSGGPILITLPDLYNIGLHFGDYDEDHGPFVNKAVVAPHLHIGSAAAVDVLLMEVENAIRILKFHSDIPSIDGELTTGSLEWDEDTGRGARADMKYMHHMLTELRFPSSGPLVSTTIVTDLGLYNQRMYGEALYAISKKSGTPDVRIPVIYPQYGLETKAWMRRGYIPMNPYLEAGWDGVIGGCNDLEEVGIVYGFKVAVGKCGDDVCATQLNISYMDRFGSWVDVADELDMESAADCKYFLCTAPLSDHQWNEAMFSAVTGDVTDVKLPEQPAAYAFHQPLDVPAEGVRVALATAYDIDFRR